MSKKIETRFKADQLMTIKEFRKKYQIDFAKLVLADKEYTIEEAENILDKFFKKGGNK